MYVYKSRAVTLSLVACFACGLAASTVSAEQTLRVAFRQDGGLFFVSRIIADGQLPLQASLEALVAGPTDDEFAAGIYTAILQGTTVKSVQVDTDRVRVDLSEELLQGGLDEALYEAIAEQFRWTVEVAGYGSSVTLTVNDSPLRDYLPPLMPVGKRPEGQQITSGIMTAAGSALSGKKVSLSPGHGYRWGGSGWVYDRPVLCAPLSREDHHNLSLCIYLNTYLEQDGATVPKYRCHDKSQGNDPYTGSPWWYMSGSYWIKELGYPCSVYANSSGDCTLGSGGNESSDCIRSRPLASNYDGADVHISMHTNGLSGYCIGGGCPNGTGTYYDADDGTWGPPSAVFAQHVQSNIVSVIRNHYGDATWQDRGTPDGNFAETSYPTRPSILIELAFHDTCDRDGLYLQDEFFRSATMWGVYKGVCDYLGKTPTFDFYSCEYVSDTIPTVMEAKESYSVSVTFRNRGALWSQVDGFRLGAGGDADPFAPTRHLVSGHVGPGREYSFNFTMTAPATPDTYTTDWQMLREGVTWFGPVLTKTVTVEPAGAFGDFDRDGDVDMADFGHFQVCLSGATEPQDDPECQNAKFDGDSDVDQNDLTAFLGCLSGADVIADPDCPE